MIFIKDKRINSIINLSRQAFGKYKLQIIVLTILGFLSGILEGIGVNALIPLFSYAINKDKAATDFISRSIEKFFTSLSLEANVNTLLIFIIILFIGRAVISVILNYIKMRIEADYEEKTRQNVFQKILMADWPYLLKQKLGYLETVLIVDVPAGAVLLSEISNAIMIGTSLIIYILVALNISPTVTLTTLIVGAVLLLTFKPFIYKMKQLSYKITALNKELAHHANENIMGIKTVKAAFAEKGVEGKGKDYFAQLKKLRVDISLIKSITRSFIQPVSLIFICAIFYFTYHSPNFNFAALVAIVYLIEKIFTYIQQVQNNLHTINEYVPHLRSVLNYEKKAKDYEEMDRGKKKFVFNKQLQFNHVSFAYNDDRQILTDIDFNIAKGELVGLIGPSGVGKTTLVDLILRLLTPTQGQILLDQQNIKDITLKDWRQKIGYVSQDIFLMNDTVENNIRFYNKTLTKNEIIAVAKMANIYEQIINLPDKFNTIIGERGIMLSVGQRQRIVIARILARQPELLILDEATSALDNESEIKIQEVIKKLKGKITVLVVAHRLSTVIDSGRLIVLEDGRIVEQGPPAKLLEDQGSYFSKVYNLRK